MAPQMETICTDQDRTPRTAVNKYYTFTGMGVIKEAASENPECTLLYDVVNQKIRCMGVLEQLGRMLDQDGYPLEAVTSIAIAAAGARADGVTSKSIERYIAHGRKTGEW